MGQFSGLIFSKSKVAPLKSRPLPTLELLSVFLAFKSLNSVLEAFPETHFKKIRIFVDAQIVLSWILSGQSKNKNIFVNNRIKDILSIKDTVEKDYKSKFTFNYINTLENPADMVTRGISTKQFKQKLDLWLKGPEWIKENPTNWPQNSLKCLSEENKQNKLTESNTKTQVNLQTCHSKVLEPILNFQDFSNIQKLYRITSILFKFQFKLLKSTRDPYIEAKKYWLKFMQGESFKREIEFLKKKDSSKAQEIPSLVNQLNLFLDESDLLRSRGRISKTLLYNYDVLNPIMLGKNHHLSKLIIRDLHSSCQHLGIQTTIDFIRSHGYWVPRARQTVKKVLSECVTCQKFNSIPFKYPKMTDLPKDRVNLIRPFEHVGVDYTGHIFVKDSQTSTSSKMYILIFTCLNVRAIHIDLLPDMSAQTFLLSFQRFTNMHGIPAKLYSDNAKSFGVGGDILHQSMSSNMFNEHMKMNNIQHHKIPLYSAWVGSTWERLIRVVKSCLYKTIGRAKLNYFELLTSLSTIKNVINSRPLTYRSSENNFEVISPNSFLKPYGNSNIQFQSNNDLIWDRKTDYLQSELATTLEIQDEVLEHFRQLWFDNYLLSLRETSRNLYQSDWTNRIKLGQVVLIKVPNKTRPFWNLGRVMEIIIGYDNKIRSVLIKKSDGQLYHYSISHLYPLELSLTHNSNDQIQHFNDSNIQNINENSNDQNLQVPNDTGEGNVNNENLELDLSAQNDQQIDSEIQNPENNESSASNTHSQEPQNQFTSTGRPIRKAATEFRKLLQEKLPYL
jgi:hypothetical protein